MGIASTASAVELRVAFNIASLEVEAHSAGSPAAGVERVFNVLAQPEMRARYDRLLSDSDAPALFPYGGVGILTVGGYLAKDQSAFFCHRIVSFLPEVRSRRISIPVRRFVFYDQHAHYKDSHHQVEVTMGRQVESVEAFVGSRSRRRRIVYPVLSLE